MSWKFSPVELWNPLGCSGVERTTHHHHLCECTPAARAREDGSRLSGHITADFIIFAISPCQSTPLFGSRCKHAHDWLFGWLYGGNAVPDDPDEASERPQHLYEFLQVHRLCLQIPGYLKMIRSSGKRVSHGTTSESYVSMKEENRSISSRSACSNLSMM